MTSTAWAEFLSVHKYIRVLYTALVKSSCKCPHNQARNAMRLIFEARQHLVSGQGAGIARAGGQAPAAPAASAAAAASPRGTPVWKRLVAGVAVG